MTSVKAGSYLYVISRQNDVAARRVIDSLHAVSGRLLVNFAKVS